MKPLFISLILLALASCHKTLQQNCGCNFSKINTVDNINGTLYHDSSQNKYYIIYGNPGLQVKAYICNSSFSEFQSIVSSPPDHVSDSYWIVFSGDLKDYCKNTSIFYLDIMRNIDLTSIKKY
jgi:hypothetical protein